MVDWSPITLWKRFLALPMDSRGKTLAVAFLVSAVCAILVSSATVMLRPIQKANRAAEQQMRLESLVSAIPGMAELMAETDGGALTAVVIDLSEGHAAEGVTPGTIAAALETPANWTALSPEDDMALIGSRPDFAQVFLLRQDDVIKLAILPVFGAGYNGQIQAMLALRSDMNTIAGVSVVEHSETPGLGARIDEPGWQASFAGTQVRGSDGTLRFDVARGPSASEYEVDGITGATRTSNSISRIVRFWMGEHGYGPLIDAVRRGEF